MPRLDNRRVGVWQRWRRYTSAIERAIDADLRREWTISLGLFDVLAAIREFGDAVRPLDLAEGMGIPPSSLSRRLDRLAEEAWVERRSEVDPDDGRAVEVILTPSGRKLWREMSITYRRTLQREFARYIDEDQLEDVIAILDAVGPARLAKNAQMVAQSR